MNQILQQLSLLLFCKSWFPHFLRYFSCPKFFCLLTAKNQRRRFWHMYHNPDFLSLSCHNNHFLSAEAHSILCARWQFILYGLFERFFPLFPLLNHRQIHPPLPSLRASGTGTRFHFILWTEAEPEKLQRHRLHAAARSPVWMAHHWEKYSAGAGNPE